MELYIDSLAVDRTNNAEIIEDHPGMQTGKMNPDNNNPNRYETDNMKKTQIKQTMTTKALVFVIELGHIHVCGSFKSFAFFFVSLSISNIISKNKIVTELSLFSVVGVVS